MKLPNNTVSIKNPRAASDLEIIPLELSRVMVNPSSGSIAVVQSDDKEVAFPLSVSDGTIMSFIHRGLSDRAHIQTIHQMYIKLLKSLEMNIESVIFESKVGDIGYASVCIVNKTHTRIWHICSYADGIILASLAQCSLGAVKTLWESFDDFNDWPYENHMVSLDDDDDIGDYED